MYISRILQTCPMVWALGALLLGLVPVAQGNSDGLEPVGGGLQWDPTPKKSYIAPPEIFDAEDPQKTATFIVNFNAGSCPAANITPWSADARAAFQYAVDIWASILISDQIIEIDACWRNDLAATTLGSASPADFKQDFSGAPQSNTWYPIALANELRGSALNGTDSEIGANFNSSFNWYFGTDGNVDVTQVDFVSVVLHEIGHGLGFTGSFTFDDGSSPNECNGTAGVGCMLNADPFIYDRFTEDGSGVALRSYANNSIALGNALTSGAVFFDGTNANAVNGGAVVPLYLPSPWDPGSSYSHLDEAFNNTVNALMTFSLANGEANHHPGPVTMGLFEDLGWDLRALNTVYVDITNISGTYTGTSTFPFRTVTEGVLAVQENGTVRIRPGSYDEAMVVWKPMSIRADGTTVVVGQ